MSNRFSLRNKPTPVRILFAADNYRLLLYRVLLFVKRISFSWLLLNYRGERSTMKGKMEAKQVFDHYQRPVQRPIDTCRYCPRCGAKSLPASSNGVPSMAGDVGFKLKPVPSCGSSGTLEGGSQGRLVVPMILYSKLPNAML